MIALRRAILMKANPVVSRPMHIVCSAVGHAHAKKTPVIMT